LDKIFQANIDLAAQVAIQKHIISGLKEAIQIEKKKRQRGKKLNLLGEEDCGPQFFSPRRIQAARLYRDAKEAIREADRQRITNKKSQAAANKVQKEAAKAERALQVEARRQHAQEEKVRKAEEKVENRPQDRLYRLQRKLNWRQKGLRNKLIGLYQSLGSL
jgi:hypothetical protein